MRNVILHYHLFKNAGTSIDKLLESSFGAKWQNFDQKSANSRISPAEMQKIIEEHPDVLAFSSHQVVPPLPKGDFVVYPIVFIRHPIDRIMSAYLFEWGKQIGSAQPKGSLADYIQDKFSKPRANAIENFHVLQLANRGYEGRGPSALLTDDELLGRAKLFIDEVAFFGIVEKFDESIRRLKYLLKVAFPDFRPASVRANVTQDPALKLADRLESFKQQIGDDLYSEVVGRNALDLDFYEHAVEQFDRF